MSYLLFDAIFLVLPALGLLASARAPLEQPRARWAVLAMMVLAVAYTAPWDSYLVRTGVWGYGADRVHWTILSVPVEEYAFMLLQVLITSLFLLHLERWLPSSPSHRGRTVAAAGAGVWLCASILGALLIGREATRYLGLILVWASPVLAAQWVLGGGRFWEMRRLLWWSVLVPTLYLWIADWIALRLGIWAISPRHSTGVDVFGLPVEEMAFFSVTNLLIVQGMLLVLRRGEGADTAVALVPRQRAAG